MKAKKWTANEEMALLDYASKYPGNISHGMRKASIKLNRAYLACSKRYYSITKDKNVTLSFNMLSDKELIRNRKVKRYND